MHTYLEDLLRELTQEEGSSVTILHQLGDECCVEFVGSWTGWESKRRLGADLTQIIEDAVTESRMWP